MRCIKYSIHFPTKILSPPLSPPRHSKITTEWLNANGIRTSLPFRLYTSSARAIIYVAASTSRSRLYTRERASFTQMPKRAFASEIKVLRRAAFNFVRRLVRARGARCNAGAVFHPLLHVRFYCPDETERFALVLFVSYFAATRALSRGYETRWYERNAAAGD